MNLFFGLMQFILILQEDNNYITMKLGEIVNILIIDVRKLIMYALNSQATKGSQKALMFERHLGYTQNNYESLLTQIYAKALNTDTIPTIKDDYGQRYQVDIEIMGIYPHQKEIVRTGWIVSPLNNNVARLVTLYVRKKHD